MNAMNNRLTVIATDIRSAHQGIQASAVQMAEHVINAGTLLIEAKSKVQHGEWDDWLISQTGMNARTARRYMQIARSGIKTATVADIGIRGASEAIARTMVGAKTQVAADKAAAMILKYLPSDNVDRLIRALTLMPECRHIVSAIQAEANRS